MLPTKVYPVTLRVTTKATSNAAWWIKTPSNLNAEKIQKQTKPNSFYRDFKDLFRNISLHGYKYLFASNFTVWEKLIWLSLHVSMFCVVIVALSLSWDQFVGQYFVINLQDPLFPVEKVPFPAVSVCSNNRISLREAMSYANELQKKDPANHTLDYYLAGIRNFTDFYYKYENTAKEGDYSNFQAFLDNFETAENESFFNMSKIMQRLTPSCKNFIQRCWLAGKEIDCFTKISFQDSQTMFGPCCTFNLNNTYAERNYKNRFVGSGSGLILLLNSSILDEFNTILNIIGYVVIVHNPDDFADISSGGSQVVFPTFNQESFVPISARVIDTDDDLRQFHSKNRKCYFDEETASPPSPNRQYPYSFVNCVTRYRIRSIMALCGCLPFFMPLELVGVTFRDGMMYCNLQHITCLLRYDFKWRSILTESVNIPGLEREAEDALYCPFCLPSCYDVQYKISLLSLPTERYAYASRSNDSLLERPNLTVLRVYFNEPTAKYYRRVLANTWYEGLSNVGNILSIFIGFCIMAVFEVLYVLSKHLIAGFKKYVKQNNDSKNAQMKGDIPEVQLYICP
ncbi:sodium channel protein Nach-like [Teleopsis dalmanni]|uniref:sodium channel protein Nach-like n=1 Tax=Teleopsis dalmanni TaxID=139649 RepID=UPI0018CEB40A|nr:sodium channel protein Nach-like [Teleopsis dalmanni]